MSQKLAQVSKQAWTEDSRRLSLGISQVLPCQFLSDGFGKGIQPLLLSEWMITFQNHMDAMTAN